MKILIAYGSTEGQTKKIAVSIADTIRGMGHEAALLDTSNLQSDIKADAFDKIILAASVHEERHQESIEVFVLGNIHILKSKPTLFLSVSLAAAFDNGADDAQRYIDIFAENVGWKPETCVPVAGAIKHDEYGHYREQVLAHVVLKGRELDDPDADYEFTDWDDLRNRVDAFVGSNDAGS